MKRILAYMAGLAVFALCGYVLGREAGHGDAPTERTSADTLWMHDTIVREHPVPVLSKVVRWDTVYIERNNYYHDTVRVELPIERKVYGDSTYRAVVTGWKASLDTMEVFCSTRVVHVLTERVKEPPRWSLGVTAGPSLLITPGGSVHGGLGVTAGVSYRF